MSLVDIKHNNVTFASIDNFDDDIILNTKDKKINDFIEIKSNINPELVLQEIYAYIAPTAGSSSTFTRTMSITRDTERPCKIYFGTARYRTIQTTQYYPTTAPILTEVTASVTKTITDNGVEYTYTYSDPLPAYATRYYYYYRLHFVMIEL